MEVYRLEKAGKINPTPWAMAGSWLCFLHIQLLEALEARRLARLKMGRIESTKKKEKDWTQGKDGKTGSLSSG